MPNFLVPHKSGAHRTAALALYRALLSQCKKTNLPVAANGDGTPELYNLIRHRFRGFRYCTSHRQLKVAFEAGYEAVDCLDAVVQGDETARGYVEALLTRAPRRSKRGEGWGVGRSERGDGTAVERGGDGELGGSPAGEQTRSEGSLVRKIRAPETELDAGGVRARKVIIDEGPEPIEHKKKRSILDRPIPKDELGGTGQRQVPILFNANHIPVLRFKKPQSPHLSAYINNRIGVRQKRHDRRQALEADIQLAREEDRWDWIVKQHTGVDGYQVVTDDGTAMKEPSWKTEYLSALEEVNGLLSREKGKNRAMGEKMFKIVQRERELALLEMEDGGVELGGLVDDIVDAGNRRAKRTLSGEYQPLD